MTTCPTCGAQAPDPAAPAAGVAKHAGHWAGAIFKHVPHPHIARRKDHAPKPQDTEAKGPIGKFNAALGVRITEAVGTMWCAYLFAALALVSLPEAIKGGTATLVAWVAQTFIQLVLLSIIMVGQKIAGAASDKRQIDTYNDAEAVLHESLQIQQHLAAQDACLQHLVETLGARATSAGGPTQPPA